MRKWKCYGYGSFFLYFGVFSILGFILWFFKLCYFDYYARFSSVSNVRLCDLFLVSCFILMVPSPMTLYTVLLPPVSLALISPNCLPPVSHPLITPWIYKRCVFLCCLLCCALYMLCVCHVIMFQRLSLVFVSFILWGFASNKSCVLSSSPVFETPAF